MDAILMPNLQAITYMYRLKYQDLPTKVMLTVRLNQCEFFRA